MIVIIPARGGSRRIPRKNIRDFHGKPIIAHSIELAKQTFEALHQSDPFKLISGTGAVYATTDDAHIANVAKEWGAEVIERPPELARDEIGSQEVVRHALGELNAQGHTEVCALYATAPLLMAGDIVMALMHHWKDPRYTCRYSTDPDGNPSGGFYIARAAFFEANLDPYQHGFAWPTADIDINTEEDWKMAEKRYEEIYGT